MDNLVDPYVAQSTQSYTDFVTDGTSFADLLASLSSGPTTPYELSDDLTLGSGLLGLADSNPDLTAVTPSASASVPKIGARFTKDVVRTLRKWLAIHKERPYPNEEEMAMLMNHTGLNKTQISNWFANARRRGYVHGVRPASPHVDPPSTKGVDIIPRPGTPAPQRDARMMKPLERWVESPPEHEPADVSDIARAMASNSRDVAERSSRGAPGIVRYNSWQSPYNASSRASSVGTSHSSDFPNYSSSGSQSSLKISKKPRKRRTRRHRRAETQLFSTEIFPFQCTFCTETFKTKHDWSRHEKSLHLPLERWVCSLNGPRKVRPASTPDGSDEVCCAFCGVADPDDAHVEGHGYQTCRERNQDERTFHRKDHLVQHLRLVHDVKFLDSTMKEWKVHVPDIESRCGFCEIKLATWTDRTEHLAEHFKMGKSMADWKGDWGFDDAVVKLVENAILPYLNSFERSTPFPMKATDFQYTPLGSPVNAYELIKLEIMSFMQIHLDTTGKLPSDDDIQLESCRVIFATELSDHQDFFLRQRLDDSWLRDLIMSSSELARQAKFGPMRLRSESRLLILRIKGKEKLFERCPFESQLRQFIEDQKSAGTAIHDAQIQGQACQIVREMELESTSPSDIFASWVAKLVYRSTEWLADFKKRTGIEPTSQGYNTTLDPGSALPLLDNNHTNNNADPTLLPLTQQDLDSIHTVPDPSLPNFKSTHLLDSTLTASWMTHSLPERSEAFGPGDTLFNRYFVGDLARWVAATMSPTNPVSHVPTDEEIQHQARWIMYDDGDPWNQTPADVPEWLWRFKRDIGMLKESYASYLIGNFVTS